jgi:cytochrome c peroxidase
MKMSKWFLCALVAAFAGCGRPSAQPATAPAGSGAQEFAAAHGGETIGGDSANTKPPEAVPANTRTTTASGAVVALPINAIFTIPAASGPDDRLSIEEIKALLDDPKNHEPIVPVAPVRLGDVASTIPKDNPMTRAKIELGRMLYFDKRLSRDSTVSCATCHDPATGWAQNTAMAVGINGQKGGRNSPTIMNRALGKIQFWDGRAATLEDQALGPIQNPIEMGFTLDELLERLKGIEGYRLCFEKIFGGVSADAIAKAIATFERTVLVGESPFDYYEAALPFRSLSAEDLKDDPELAAKAKAAIAAADAHALSAAAERGRVLFFDDKKGRCSQCHVGANLADEQFYNIGVGVEGEAPDPGRKAVTKNDKDTGAFKTPTVRNIALTAPYMHDGSQATLMDVVDHYDKGGTANPYLHERIKKLGLTQQEKEDLVAFMKEGLTGPLPDIRAPKLP